jgi:hypothetical protein
MQAHWRHIPFRIETLDDQWDDLALTPGIYVIRSDRSIPRVSGADPFGILYVGKSAKLGNRLLQFWNGAHPASGFLYADLRVASIILARLCQDEQDVADCLSKLSVRVATPVPIAELETAERAVLYTYLYRFGEPPPLNFDLPQSWGSVPNAEELRWAVGGLAQSG